MASICKGICVRHKAKGPASFGRYLRGQKRCQVCQIFLEWNGGWCPCCGTKLRTRSRNWKYGSKSKTNESVDIGLDNLHRKLVPTVVTSDFSKSTLKHD